MKIQKFLFSLLILIPTVEAKFNVPLQTRAVYGIDNRGEAYSAPSSIKNLTRSILGKFSDEILVLKNGSYVIQSVTLGQKHKTNCSSVKFSEQITAANCTGFLVAPNIIATAGHCMKTEDDCKHFLWAFDFQLKSAGDTQYTKIPSANVYQCKKILAKRYEHYEGLDYTLIQLDRSVTDRTPLPLDLSGETAIGTPLFTLGYPSGLPLKYTSLGNISADFEKVYYSDLDTFGGNSGAPVFNALTEKVTGIVSMGNADYVWNASNTCKVVKICGPSDKCAPSVSCKISQMKADYEASLVIAK